MEMIGFTGWMNRVRRCISLGLWIPYCIRRRGGTLLEVDVPKKKCFARSFWLEFWVHLSEKGGSGLHRFLSLAQVVVASRKEFEAAGLVYLFLIQIFSSFIKRICELLFSDFYDEGCVSR